ncbi:MAG TPA: response regulator transcription factor [Dyella sp.]|uniref:response regulator transcription factor n=1 Tax=Dyella sp. TaxID=1869338 RepID=UPI002F94906F
MMRSNVALSIVHEEEKAEPLRVVVADDHPVCRYGVRAALKAMGHDVIAEVASSNSLLDAAEHSACDMVITDYIMPGDSHHDGHFMLQNLRRVRPDMPVVVMTSLRNLGLLKEAMREGIQGWVDKAEGVTELAAAVGAARAGQTYVSKSIRSLLVKHEAKLERRPVRLTHAEARVLRMSVSEGATLQVIADRLGFTYKSASKHKRAALAKLYVQNDMELYEYCRWVDLDDELDR